MASSSDPKTGKVDTWGFADGLVSQQFADSHPGEVPYGLGAGDVVGVPNTMDVSQTYGLIYAEGYPGGRAYYRSIEEKRGRHLACPLDQTNLHQPESGIPSIRQSAESLCSVWISKTGNIPDMSCGFVGMLVGSSQGILSSYSLGTNGLLEKRLDRGELTARWVLSPGVPITAIAVDETFSIHRQSLNRFWAIVLNALGEVFYIVDFPIASTRPVQQIGSRSYPVAIETLAWDVGRTVHWMLVEPTRRTARLDPFDKAEVDGSYTPRSSWHGVGLNKEQIAEETREINSFLQKKPKDFQKMCHGWDMRRRLEVDFSSGDKHGAGESIIIISCGLDEGQHAGIKRYTHYKLKESFGGGNRPEGQTSIFDSGNSVDEQRPNQYSKIATLCRHNSATFSDLSEAPLAEEWRSSIFVFGGLKVPQINTTAIDMSSIAMMTMTEDPLLCLNESSVISSPMSPPPGQMPFSKSATDVPGQRARLLAVGTTNGTIILWNMRAPTANNDSLENNVNPLRVIYTDSPQISCLAMTALYLVHGGNDGLVQAWDPLASNTDPIRTLNSRFSSRARRRLIQAEVSPAGVGINLFAAGAICLDPDPTMLRGMVSLGSYLRYWSYSSQAADQYKGNKRRLRRSERGSNQASDRFSGTGRGALKDYIANEKLELEREKRIRRKDEERLSGRYGVDLLGPGATEDEILAYATMLSEEAHQSDELRRQSSSNSSSSGTITEEAVASPVSGSPQEDLDHDLAEAIRLSLEDSNGFRASGLGNNDASASMFAVRYGKKKKLLPLSSSPPSDIFTGADRGASPPVAELDLEFALQLSQAEEQNLANKAEGSGKGKGRSKS
ncbi:hypothetical protein MMC21_003512 [Puttea exsequens]|nr:hypothetical protein [Puttea exsequens]